MVKLAALAAALLLYSPSALAWGGLGHEAICELAFRELDDTARQRVIALIQQDQEFPTFRASCNWPDRPRQRAPSTSSISRATRPASMAMSARWLTSAWSARSSTTSPFWHRRARPTRRSWRRSSSWATGSATSTSPCTPGPGRQGRQSLRTRGSSCESSHTLWDSCIVEERLGCIRSRSCAELQAGITDEQRAEWLASDAVAWANELFAIAREPEVGYCVMVGDTCQYAADNREFDEGEPEKVVVIDDAYLDRHASIARERIAMAGIRLAGLLNRALSDQSP